MNIRFLVASAAVFATVCARAAVPVVDISQDASRQVVIAEGTTTVYQGHPTTLLADDGKTMFCVWTIGHAGPCGPMARSDDGGLTWTRLDATLPAAYGETYRNCPTLQKIVGPDGKTRYFVFSAKVADNSKTTFATVIPDTLGLAILVSEDGGATWRDSPYQSQFWAAMPPTAMMRLKDGTTAIFGQMPKDSSKPEQEQQVWMAVSEDGGFTWGDPRTVAAASGKNLCEPCCIRSPDGTTLALLMRENNHTGRSMMCFSSDEGATWTTPVDTSAALTGDRHEAIALPDGRYLIAFRNRTVGDPLIGQYMAWVGTWEELVGGQEKGYRIRLLEHHGAAGNAGINGWPDTGYSGVELLADGTIVCTTYSRHFADSRLSSVVATRFKIAETDALLDQRGKGVFYVSTTGSDNANGRSWESAVQTLKKATDLAEAAEGGTVYIADGTYYPTEMLQPTKAVKYIGASGDATKVILNASQISSNARRLFNIQPGHGDDGFEVRYVTMCGCTFSASSGQPSGVAFFLFHGRISHCIVRDCSNGLTIGFIGGTGVIDNCLFYNNSYLNAQVNTLNGYGSGSPHAIVNCTFIAGSNSTSKPNVSVPDADAEEAKVINCVDCGSSVPLSGPEGCFVSCPAVGTQAFVGYPNDLSPIDAALWDAGVDVSEYGVPGAAVDLAGRRRVVGTRIDIGAYEQQRLVIGHALSTEVVGVPVEFSGACGTGSDIVWNFGDGTAEVQGKAVTHAFASAGSYCVRFRLASASDYSSGDTVRVKIVPAEANSVYVATTGSDSNPGTAAQPFATVAKAVTTLGTGTGNVFIKDGVYSLDGQLAPTGPIVISSLADDPTKVTLRPSVEGKRHLMGNTGIRCQMRSVTLTGAREMPFNNAGSVALLVDARLSNCIITGNSGGAGIVTLCGSAVAENCLFYNNVPVGNGEGRIFYATGIAGTSHFVNCTFLSTGHSFPAVAIDETADGWVVGCACFARESSAITVRKDRYVSCAGNFDNADSPRWVRTTAAEAFGKDGQWVPCKESPLINAGPTWAEYRANGGLSRVDLNGNKRRSGDRLDIGCCETKSTGFCILFR